MTTLLQLNSSLFLANGQSSQLANEFVSENWLIREKFRELKNHLGKNNSKHKIHNSKIK